MSSYATIRCLRCTARRLRAEIIALDGTPPPVCCVVWLPGAPASLVIRRLSCQVKTLATILAALEGGGTPDPDHFVSPDGDDFRTPSGGLILPP